MITHSQLDHPNIIPLLGVYYEAPEPPMMVVPFAERGSLGDLLRTEVIEGIRFVHIVGLIATYMQMTCLHCLNRFMGSPVHWPIFTKEIHQFSTVTFIRYSRTRHTIIIHLKRQQE